MRRSPRTLLLAATVLAAALTLTTPAAAAAPTGLAPGTLLAATPVTAHLGPLPLPGLAWTLSYRSRTATGDPDTVSGTLLLPAGSWPGQGPRPIVTYAIGTHGLGDRCAPSVQIVRGTDPELVLMQQALARGWAVVVTDYEGLGTPGPHTYTVALSEAHAVLDAVRAAVAVPGAGLVAAAPVGIWGYSQGGGAAGAAAEQAAGYAPELDVRGVAVGGVPAELAAVLAANRDNPAATGLMVAASAGFDAAYPQARLRELLTPAGQEIYDAVREQCTGEITATGSRYTPAQVTVAAPSAQAAQLQAENGVGGRAPVAPALVYHGGADELIPVALGRGLRRDWCARGATVGYLEIPAAQHVGAAILGAPAAVQWLADRFDGAAARSACG